MYKGTILLLITILLTIGGFMFAKLNSIDKGQTDLKIAFAKQEAMMQMMLLKAGFNFSEIDQEAQKAEEKAKSQN
jgi:hypothetical protein